MAFQYLIEADALARAMELSQEADYDNRAAFAGEINKMSAGSIGAITIYRPMYNAGYLIATSLEIDHLEAATGEVGAKFRDRQSQAQKLFEMQLAIDRSTPEIVIPPGFSAIEALARFCGCNSSGGGMNVIYGGAAFTV